MVLHGGVALVLSLYSMGDPYHTSKNFINLLNRHFRPHLFLYLLVFRLFLSLVHLLIAVGPPYHGESGHAWGCPRDGHHQPCGQTTRNQLSHPIAYRIPLLTLTPIRWCHRLRLFHASSPVELHLPGGLSYRVNLSAFVAPLLVA